MKSQSPLAQLRELEQEFTTAAQQSVFLIEARLAHLIREALPRTQTIVVYPNESDETMEITNLVDREHRWWDASLELDALGADEFDEVHNLLAYLFVALRTLGWRGRRANGFHIELN